MNRRTPVVCVPALVLGLALSVDVSYAANQPPVARFTVTPGSGRTFVVDASASTDDKTPVAKLKVRWDWENDGVWDTAYTTVKTASHKYASEGTYTIVLQVLDEGREFVARQL